jgi:hypothetical protein
MYCLFLRISALLGQLTDRLGGSEHLGLCVLVGEAEPHHPLLHGAEGFVDEGRTMSARPDTDAVVLPEDVGGTGGVLIPEVQGDDGRAVCFVETAINFYTGTIFS